MRGNDVEREWIRGAGSLRGARPRVEEGGPTDIGRLVFRSRSAETVFCVAVLLSIPGLLIRGPTDPVLGFAGKVLGSAVGWTGLFRGG